MNDWSAKAERINPMQGALFRRTVPTKRFALYDSTVASPLGVSQRASRGAHRLAFAGIYLFTLLVYLRPHEIIPGVFFGLPAPKLVAISVILIYIGSKLSASERLITWSLELKMMTLVCALGFLFAPMAASPADSFNVLFDPLLKLLLVLILQINLVDTRQRFHSMLGIIVFCEALYSLSSIKTFLTGGFAEATSFHTRIDGWGSQLGNPNDIACVLALMAPFTVIRAMMRRGWKRWFYFACVGVTVVAILFTYSRSGFIALTASCSLLIWKATRGRRVKMLLSLTALAAVMLASMPGRYMVRLSTIINPETDTTHSAQERQEHMKRAFEVAKSRPIFGVGIGNFHIYSISEMRAHNAYLEMAAELGVIGLIAFLVIIFAPLRSLRRIERETAADGPWPDPGKYTVSVCLQASFVAFLVYGFFGSIQYDSYLYSLVAFAVAFRRIHAAEIQAAAGAGNGAESPLSKALAHPAKGAFWRSREVRECRLKGNMYSRLSI
ncbi:MAG TPA: O-antigen ligase family protein [Blastocatellia bacterium]|nr:O-antigen ligase family protein [Blastocatellia bacterium]